MAMPTQDGEFVTIGPWTVLSELGDGAMGAVLLVRKDDILGVMKVPLASVASDPAALERFRGEGRRMAELQGRDNLVQVIDLGIDPETAVPYIVMEFVQGCDLALLTRLMRANDEAFTVELAVWLGSQTIRGLHGIHSLVVNGQPRNLCHLDYAPKNVFLSVRGGVKIGDFGISRSLDDRTKSIHGTLRYMAPEHLVGKPAQASDVYAWGMTQWELLEGEPYRYGGLHVDMRASILAEHRPRRITRVEVPGEYASLLYAALDPAPGHRPRADEIFAATAEMSIWRPRELQLVALLAEHVVNSKASGRTILHEPPKPATLPNLAGLVAVIAALKAKQNKGLDGLIAGRGSMAKPRPAAPPEPVAPETTTVREPGSAPPLAVSRTTNLARDDDAPQLMPAPSETVDVPLAPDGRDSRPWAAQARPSHPVTGEQSGSSTGHIVPEPTVTVAGIPRSRLVLAASGFAALATGAGALTVYLTLAQPPGTITPSSAPIDVEVAEPNERAAAPPEVEAEPESPLLDPLLLPGEAVVPAVAVTAPPEPQPEPTPAAKPEPGQAVEPTPAATVAIAEPTAPSVAKPKAAAVPKVSVAILVEWIPAGVQVKIGAAKFTVPESEIFKVPSGKVRIKWRAIGTEAWTDGGMFDLRAGMGHTLHVGKVGGKGVKHIAKGAK